MKVPLTEKYSSFRFMRLPSDPEKLVVKSGKVVSHIPAGDDVTEPDMTSAAVHPHISQSAVGIHLSSTERTVSSSESQEAVHRLMAEGTVTQTERTEVFETVSESRFMRTIPDPGAEGGPSAVDSVFEAVQLQAPSLSSAHSSSQYLSPIASSSQLFHTPTEGLESSEQDFR